jgi:uncharacterized protein involved in exopolysaccharide biosynthesis
MKRNLRQFASANSLRPPDGASVPPASTPPVSAPHAFPSNGAEQALFRFDLRRSLEMHRRLAIGFAVAGLVLAAAYLFMFWSAYSAQCLVYVQPTPSAVLEGAAPIHWPYNYDPATYDAYVQQQILSMTRQDVLVGALHKLEPGVWQQSGESDESAAERLKRAIEVAREGTGYQVSITAHASNPDTAAALANAVAGSYIEDTSHEQRAGDAERLAMLKEERDRVKKELDDDRAEQAALNAQLGVAAIGPVAPEHYDDDIAKIHDDLVKARTDHDEAAARLTAMNAGNGLTSTALDAEADQLIATDPGLASLKTALLQRRAALVSQMANLTPSNPQYKQDAEELGKIDVSLDSATRDLRAKAAARIEQQLHTDLDRTSGMEARLNGELARMTKAAAGATPKLQRASDLANDITRLQNRFSTVDEQLQNQILEDNAPGTAHLAVAAVAPQHPAVSGVIRNALVLFLGFVFLGLAAAVIAQKLDPKVYIASDVEQLLGFAPMAQLPDFFEVPDEVADEHLLRLAAGIEYACKDGGMRSCIFTGAGPQAGVTTVATRVRDMLEAMGRTTLLVNASGSAAAEQRGANDRTQPAARSTALLQQAAEEAEIADEGLVLTDAAPLAVSAETEYLVRFADCTIVVVESGATTRAQVRDTASRLHRLNVAAVGFVLNRVGLAKADPAFRHSVEAVEKHLRAQSRFTARLASSGRLVTAGPVRSNGELAAPVAAATAPTRPALAAAMTTAPVQATVAEAPVPLPQPDPVAAPPAPALPRVWADFQPSVAPPAPVLTHAWKEFEPIVAATPVAPQVPQQPEPFAAPPVLSSAGKDFEPIVAAEPVLPPARLEPQPVAAQPVLPPAQLVPHKFVAMQHTPVFPKARPEPEPVAAPTSEIPWLTETPTYGTALEQLGKAHAPHTRLGLWETALASEGGKETAVAAEETARATPSRLSGLRGLFLALGLKEERHAAPEASEAETAPAPQLERAVFVQDLAPVPAPPEQTVPAQTFVPVPEPEPLFAADSGNGSRKDSTRRVTAEPEFLPPKPLKPAHRDRSEAFDDVQILPSWRGQYKGKD